MKSCILFILAALLSPPLWAQPVNRIDQVLEEQVKGMDEGSIVEVIIVLRDQVDVSAMREAFNRAHVSKDYRHFQVVTALRQKAEATQGPLLGYLAAQKQDGEVQYMESKWIVNMIYAHCTKRALYQLAKREDIAMIYYDGPLTLDAPVEEWPSDVPPGSAEPGLRAINAHRLWELGYNGQGTIVMNIDTGVQGSHPAFAPRWRGNEPGVPWYHAWFDQKTPPSTVPVDYGSTTHGTHTMGIMTGLDAATADTIGIAFGAQWIASPTIDVGFSPHTTYTLNAFQWAADPDSIVNTSNDVPDVISNSYQDPNVSSTECNGASGYWAVIDAIEAIGTAVTFSAGNAGPGTSTITAPKNRITTDVNIFSLGNLNTSTAQPWVISNSSSRGPSSCDNTTIKPEVVAPGTSIRSSIGGSTYGIKSGTSMASPHAAGAIALLRSANPSLTGTELKEILYNTAVDYGPAGEDNTYGNGLIDIWAAFQLVSVAAARIEGTVTGGGDTLAGVRVDNVTTSSYVETNAGGFYRFILPDTGTYVLKFSKLGYATLFDTVHAPDDSTTYIANVNMNPLPAPQVNVTPPSFMFNLSPNDSTQATLAVGNAGAPASMLAYQLRIDGGIGGLLEDVIGSNVSGFSGGLRFRGNVYHVDQATSLREIKSYHIVATSTEFRFAVYENTSGTGTFTQVYNGSPVMASAGTGFVSSGAINVQLEAGKYYLIGGGWNGSVTYYNGAPIPADVGFGQALYGFSSSTYPPPSTMSVSSTSTTFYYGAVTTTSGKFITVAQMEGDTIAGSVSNQHEVRISSTYLEPGTYNAGIVVLSNDTLSPEVTVPVTVEIRLTGLDEHFEGQPVAYALHQNYPNPFNPSTTMKFDLPVQGRVTMKVFDILGRLVGTVLDEEMPAGYHSLAFDATKLASGMYFYRMQSGSFTETKKMIVLR